MNAAHVLFFPGCDTRKYRDELYITEGDTMMVGGMHLSKRLMDYRTVDGDPFFGPLIAALGRNYIAELSR